MRITLTGPWWITLCRGSVYYSQRKICGGFHWSKVNEHRVKTIKQILKTERGRKNNPEKGRKNNPEKGGKNNCIDDIFSLSACLSLQFFPHPSPSLPLPLPLSRPRERPKEKHEV
jgi:hypothetical protein